MGIGREVLQNKDGKLISDGFLIVNQHFNDDDVRIEFELHMHVTVMLR